MSGEVQIVINGRPVAIRQAGTHVGEMALADNQSKRSATVVTREDTSILRVTEPQFSRIARTHPDLWRRVAVEIAMRLRERSKYIREPNAQPLVFIGSSEEGLAPAEELHRQLSKKPIVVRLWSDGVFEASKTSIENLVGLAGSVDFACLVLTPDDVMMSRGTTQLAPRDNVTFELGLFIGSLGRDRVFILKPRTMDMRIPSDLLGVTWLDYPRGGNKPMWRRMQSPCRNVWERINHLGPK